MDKKLHIVSFDVPLPANYGGVIDVFYKLKSLHEEGVEITLHCFLYGKRTQQPELEKYCEQVIYYSRATGMQGMSLLRPYIVNSRKNNQLIKNLLQDDAPILFEGLHTCYFLNHPALRGRKKYVRTHNIEHEYYRALAAAESAQWKKMYFGLEAKLLEQYEEILHSADVVFPISESDTLYFSSKYSAKYLPAFHENDAVISALGHGKFCLYQGNLSVAENRQAIEILLESVFSKLEIPIKIAGANPSAQLISLLDSYPKVELIKNPSQEKMLELMRDAHIHVLYASKQSGLKLKLLNSLFQGRFVVANENILVSQELKNCANYFATAPEFVNAITEIWQIDFTEEMQAQRKKLLETNFSNATNIQVLVNTIFG